MKRKVVELRQKIEDYEKLCKEDTSFKFKSGQAFISFKTEE
jgi:hypothetical protein